MDIKLVCSRCGNELPIVQQSYCPQCGGVMTVWYSSQYLKNASSHITIKQNFWGYRKMLPPLSDKNVVSFGEGGTPLTKSCEIGNEIGISELYFKDETKNPTGSFKDRSITECVSMAKEFECTGVVVASSGNGAASTSAYGTKAGLDTVLFVPEATPLGKVAQAIAYGGKVIKVRGSFSHCYNAAMAMAKEKHYMNATTTFLSPYGIEGYKTIAFEIFDDLQTIPDYIFIPVGAGPVLYGIWKGFDELVRSGRANKVPSLICAQAEGCSPISTAWINQQTVTACNKPKTIASAICDPLFGYEQDGEATVQAINASKGRAYRLTDEEMRDAGIMLAKKEGLFVEISSAASLSALYKMKKEGLLKEENICVCILTGHGLKDAAAYIPDDYKVPVINSIEEL